MVYFVDISQDLASVWTFFQQRGTPNKARLTKHVLQTLHILETIYSCLHCLPKMLQEHSRIDDVGSLQKCIAATQGKKIIITLQREKCNFAITVKVT